MFEKVHRDTPIDGLNWFFDHAETISEKVHRPHCGAGRRRGRAAPHGLPGRIFHRTLRQRPEATPPVKKILERGVKTSAGTDATRVASYNPGCLCRGW
ncbi:Spermatogenesis- and oogenesis-specific basic helix-loop-helix-containing protein 2 [Manis javanica]|nr:Spermatogenesis- and oogenesis-specific basic helix-loop-helix-containing protein 2 [Manis javanica]